MKTLLNEINGRLDITEENISELEIKTNYQKWNTRRIFKYMCIYRKIDREPERETETGKGEERNKS